MSLHAFSHYLRRPKVYTAFGVIVCLLLFLYPPTSIRRSSPGSNGERYPPIYTNKLPTPHSASLPQVQTKFPPETATAKEERQKRQSAVRERFAQTWRSYKALAYGADELMPVSGKPVMAFGGWGATLVDALDALWMLGMKEEFEDAVLAAAQINFGHTPVEEINVFETTIRYLGGLLGAYDVSGGQYPILLTKATEIGDLVYRAFDTPNRMPIMRWKLHSKAKQTASEWSLIAEIGSLNLELTRLSQLTGDSKYYDAAYRVAKAMDEAQMSTKIPGLWPIIANAQDLKFDYNAFSLGGMADSAFEYLPKMYALTGGGEELYRRDYERTIKAAQEHLFYRPMVPDHADILISGSAQVFEGQSLLEPQGQHLTCFAGGMVLLGSKLFNRPDEFEIGRKLTEGCIWAYDSMPSGIMPEVFHMIPCIRNQPCEWSEERWVAGVLQLQSANAETAEMEDGDRFQHIVTTQKLKPGYTQLDDTRYGLRPEAIESIFILYRMTGEQKYMDAAWKMFLAIDAATRTEIAHSAIDNVAKEHPMKVDKMESFWLAETLKYFYLIFSEPELMSLDRYVL